MKAVLFVLAGLQPSSFAEPPACCATTHVLCVSTEASILVTLVGMSQADAMVLVCICTIGTLVHIGLGTGLLYLVAVPAAGTPRRCPAAVPQLRGYQHSAAPILFCLSWCTSCLCAPFRPEHGVKVFGSHTLCWSCAIFCCPFQP